MMEQLTGVVGILLGIWEIYAVYKAWHSTSHENVLSESLSAKLINKIN